VYRRIGYKMGGWHDVGWYQVEIQPGSERPADPRAIGQIADTPEWHDAVKRGLDLYVDHT
jgi:phosphinothricin acetyltransferase